MTGKLKCKSCNRLMKEEDMIIRVGEKVIVDRNLTNLINSGVVLPFCKVCKTSLLDDY